MLNVWKISVLLVTYAKLTRLTTDHSLSRFSDDLIACTFYESIAYVLRSDPRLSVILELQVAS